LLAKIFVYKITAVLYPYHQDIHRQNERSKCMKTDAHCERLGYMSAPSDIPLLVKRAQEGNTEAFATLVQRFEHEIYIYLAGHLRDRDEARDVTQQVFLKAWLSLATLKEAKCFRIWLYKIARNLTYDHWRKKRCISLSWEELTTKNVVFDMPGPEARTERTELVKLALTRLSPKLRQCLLLHAVGGFSPNEIARTAGIKEGSVGTYISMARRQLRSIYHHLENEDVVEEPICL
jgi:RNA polymerase sigma-70 factor (ECF subfamily)